MQTTVEKFKYVFKPFNNSKFLFCRTILFSTFNFQLSIFLLALCFLSCKAQPTPPMTFEKDTDSIRIQKEAAFVIQLVSSYGNGYQWQIKESLEAAIIVLDSTSTYRPEDYSPKKGMENDEKVWETFYFRGVKKGTMLLHFEQVRPWQKSSVQDSTAFEVIVE